MKVENPVALRFILQDELYLLKADKPFYENTTVSQPDAPEITPVIKEPLPEVKQPEPEIKTPPVTFNYLGKNLKNFLVLVHYPELDFIDDAHLTALTNIIKRKDLGIDDIAILNTAKHSMAGFDELSTFFKPAKLLVLGQKALPAGIAQLSLNIIRTLDTLSALYSFSFGEMMDSVDNKKAFWEQMKGL